MRRPINLFFLPLVVLALGCAGPKVAERTTIADHVDRFESPGSYTLIYSLPMTTLRFHISADEVVTKSGPYHQYAGRYLGLNNVPSEDKRQWNITGVEVRHFIEADPEHSYVLKTNEEYVKSYFRLTSEGYILPMTGEHTPSPEPSFFGERRDLPQLYFPDRSMEMSVVEETRRVMRMEQRDTAFVNVPVLETVTVTRTPAEKAEEAAGLIMDIRNNRFRLISGELDLFPDGRAMEAILKEFERLEKDYISLFAGKVFSLEHSFVFEYSPQGTEPGEEAERTILFRLSDEGKILPPGDMSGRPVVLELKPEGKSASFDNIDLIEEEGEQQNYFIHRIPDAATIRLIDGDRILMKKRVLVGQYGTIVKLPSDTLLE